jgi:hypothetical protein
MTPMTAEGKAVFMLFVKSLTPSTVESCAAKVEFMGAPLAISASAE